MYNMLIKSEQVGEVFAHFVLNDWKFINAKADKMREYWEIFI